MTPGKSLIFSKLNLDSHYSLMEQRDIIYMLNGDITSLDGNGSYFAQNMLSNDICVNFPTGYSFVGSIQMNNFEYVVFLKSSSTSRISLFNTENCTITTIVEDPCLNFNTDFPIRGVYKHLNKTNERIIYWVDGLNYNRYLNIDRAVSGNYPKLTSGDICDTCNSETIDSLDCNGIRINKELKVPCLTLSSDNQGTFATGTYQIGIAYSEDNLTLTDFYFSNPVKVFSNQDNIGFNLDISCSKNPFSQYTIILVSQTKEGSLIVYNFGQYQKGIKKITLNSISNATVFSVDQALSKRVIYDKSKHIVSNDETLLLGSHEVVEPLEYQLDANTIKVEWLERKVPANKVHEYPTLMRDEVYDLAIEWLDTNGQSKGVFHIPGRDYTNDYNLVIGANTYQENSAIPSEIYLYESPDNCEELPTEIWEVMNTASVKATYEVSCENCSDVPIINKVGKMGYYRCKDLTYPNEPRWGDLACQLVRRHRMPSSDLTHIHESGQCFNNTQTIETLDVEGNPYDYTYTTVTFNEAPCANILGIRLKNIPVPKINGVPVVGWSYRLLYSDRAGNKSILHKGMVYNVFKEVDETVEIMYPNYPYNDLKPDPYLSKTQTNQSSVTPTNYIGANDYYKTRFTYHSPDVSFKETQNEFGSEMAFYTEEIGKIDGSFQPAYRHPSMALAASTPGIKSAWPYAQQFNSVAYYERFEPLSNSFKLEHRRRIDYSQFLLPVKQFVKNSRRFNNNMRETSFYVELKSDKDVPNPINEDTSRFTRGDIGCGDKVIPCESVILGGTTYPIQAVSYYTGVKVKQLNQYGQNEQIKYLPLDSCFKSYTDESLILESDFYGGDVFISKHSVLRKMPLFEDWLYDVPFDTDIDYRSKRNVYYPTYWYDTLSESNDQLRLSCWQPNAGIESSDLGYFYLWVTGNAYFWAESEFVGNYRESDATPNSRFYPKTDINTIARIDTISLQPTFLYDFSLLNTTIENKYLSGYTNSDADYTVIFSLKNDLQSSGDNWLKFLPLNYTILPPVYGKFTGMHYIDQYSVFFIFENNILYSQEDYSLQSSQGNTIFLGQGDIFTRRLRKLSNDKTGYTGSVDPFSFINTRYGTFFFDRYRKKFFQWTGELKELTGINSWLDNFTSVTDPNYKDSLIAVFDNYTNNIYFTDKINNWTVSYKPSVEGFISFHSFIPDHYLTLSNNFISVKDGFWKHNKKWEYQRYFGVPYMFDIGFVEKFPQDAELQQISLQAEFTKNLGYGQKIYNKKVFFDETFIYNNQASTGIMKNVLKNINDPNQSLIQNKETSNINEVTLLKNNTYNINKLENNQLDQNNPNISFDSTGMYYTALNTGIINPNKRESLKGDWFVVHLRNFTFFDKVLLKLNTLKLDPLTRQ